MAQAGRNLGLVASALAMSRLLLAIRTGGRIRSPASLPRRRRSGVAPGAQCAPLLALALDLRTVASTAQAQTAASPVRLNAGTAGHEEESATELAKNLQNPIGYLYSFPF